jgi:hypothetical protein
MQIPHIDAAVIPETKISGYLLAADHPPGRSKARFFKSLGFAQDRPAALGKALLQHAASHGVSSERRTPFGVKYLIEGDICGPEGVTARIRSIWFVEFGERSPRLVTAYPVQETQA